MKDQKTQAQKTEKQLKGHTNKRTVHAKVNK